MSSPNAMTREELLESAALDALGLLDEYESDLYTRSFHHAPAAVQDEIIQRQAQLVSDETFLPNESPDPALRQRVLDAVSVAIEFESPELEPLATIGRARAAHPANETVFAPISGRLWRAAVFVLCAGILAVAYFATQVYQYNSTIAMLALNNATDAQLEQMLGPTAKDFILDPTSKRVFFKPAGELRAVLYINESTDQAFLVVEGLSASQEPIYTLSLKGDDGEVQELKSFASNGRLSGAQIALNGVTAGLATIALQITDQSGAVLLKS